MFNASFKAYLNTRFSKNAIRILMTVHACLSSPGNGRTLDDGRRYMYNTVGELAQWMDVSCRTVKYAVAELKEAGVLVVARRRHRDRTNHYRIDTDRLGELAAVCPAELPHDSTKDSKINIKHKPEGKFMIGDKDEFHDKIKLKKTARKPLREKKIIEGKVVKMDQSRSGNGGIPCDGENPVINVKKVNYNVTPVSAADMYAEVFGGTPPPVTAKTASWVCKVNAGEFGDDAGKWREFFRRIAEVPFLMRLKDRMGRWFLDWILKFENMAKILSGFYHRFMDAGSENREADVKTEDEQRSETETAVRACADPGERKLREAMMRRVGHRDYGNWLHPAEVTFDGDGNARAAFRLSVMFDRVCYGQAGSVRFADITESLKFAAADAGVASVTFTDPDGRSFTVTPPMAVYVPEVPDPGRAERDAQAAESVVGSYALWPARKASVESIREAVGNDAEFAALFTAARLTDCDWKSEGACTLKFKANEPYTFSRLLGRVKDKLEAVYRRSVNIVYY